MQRETKRPKYGGRTRRCRQPTTRMFGFTVTHEEAEAIIDEANRLNCRSLSEYFRMVSIPGKGSDAIAS